MPSGNWLVFAVNNACALSAASRTKAQNKCARKVVLLVNPPEMFAKLFGQIFDSSIAEDYNCRRMFMDLLVLADSDGVVDMTFEAISRRTNVPLPEVTKYINELQQPDPSSRSKAEDGRRLVPIDSQRGWGWQIVNYNHYRAIKDEEARRSYFRDVKRRQRKSKKCPGQKLDTNGQLLTPSSASSSSSKSSCTQKEAEDFCVSLGLPASDGTAMFLHWEEKGWGKVKDWQLTIRKWKSFGYLPSQKQKSGQGFQKQPDPKQTKIDKEYAEWMQRKNAKKQ